MDQSMNDTPIFQAVVVEALEFDMLPSFEPIDRHEDFLLRHQFTRWLTDMEAKVRLATGREGGLELVKRKRRRRR